MADSPQWFRRGSQEVSEPVGSETYKRLLKDREWEVIDGPEGDVLRREDLEEAAASAAEVEPDTSDEELELPIEDYDDLTVEQVLPHLEELDAEQLDTVEAHEIANKNRKSVLDAISTKREALSTE